MAISRKHLDRQFLSLEGKDKAYRLTKHFRGILCFARSKVLFWAESPKFLREENFPERGLTKTLVLIFARGENLTPFIFGGQQKGGFPPKGIYPL